METIITSVQRTSTMLSSKPRRWREPPSPPSLTGSVLQWSTMTTLASTGVEGGELNFLCHTRKHHHPMVLSYTYKLTYLKITQCILSYWQWNNQSVFIFCFLCESRTDSRSDQIYLYYARSIYIMVAILSFYNLTISHGCDYLIIHITYNPRFVTFLQLSWLQVL